MIKKILIFILVILLSLAGNQAAVYASNSIGQLDNQGETESTAGITWDQINEMSQNSPNSLTPTQGLVLWMFAIIAFLKLAQKMDNLLQSLGLNVTQTGGRALGDLMIAGNALRGAGALMSKSMGMLGFGRGGGSGGGTPGAGSGTRARSAGGSPAPIPAGSPGSSPTPVGSSPSSGTPPGSSPTGAASASVVPPSSSSGAGSSNPTAATRNPIGRVVDWMGQDGKAQRVIKTVGTGAAKAGVIFAKSGAVGLGVSGAKYGAAKIGSAVSARFGGSISSDPHGDGNNDSGRNNQQPIDSNVSGGSSPQGVFDAENTEDYQASRPLDGTTDQTSIPTSINREDYQDVKSSNGGDDSDYSSFNDDEYNVVAPHDAIAAAQPIPTSMDDGQDSSTKPSKPAPKSSAADTNSEEWQATKPIDSTQATVPIPSTVNKEGWQGSNPSSVSPAPTPITADSKIASQQGDSGSSVKPSTQTQHDAVVIQTPSAVTQTSEASVVVASDSSVASQGVSANVDLSSGSGYSISQDSSSGEDEGTAIYEPAPMPTHNQAIPGDFPKSTEQSGITHDSPAGSIGTDVSHNAVLQPQTQVTQETITTDLPSTMQAQSAAVASTSDSAPSMQTNTIVQSQVTETNNVTKQDSVNPIQPTPQPSSHPATQQTVTNGDMPSRPTTKGKSRNLSVKGRKRKR